MTKEMSLSVTEYTEMRQLWEQIKGVYDNLTEEVKKLGTEGAETKNKLASMETRMQEFDEKASKPPMVQEERSDGRIVETPDIINDASPSWKSLMQYGAEYAMAVSRPAEVKAGNGRPAGIQAMLKALRSGYGSLEKEQKSLVPTASAAEAPHVPGLEIKGLTITEDTTGGFFAPPEFVPEIIKGFVPYSPLLQFVRNRTTSARSIQFPKRTGTITAQWVGEKSTRTELTGYNLGRLEIPLNEMYALVLISEQDLEDPAFDLESELRNEISEQFGVALGKALISGDGSIQPQGILNHTSTLIDKSGTSDTYSLDALIDMAYKLPDPYANNARWVIKRTEIANIRKLKYASGTQGYIWEPSLVGNEPAQLLGYPITTMPDMPGHAASAHTMMLGDFNRYYVAVQRVSMTFKRLAERWVENSQIGIYARMRVGGQVVLPEAARIYSLEA